MNDSMEQYLSHLARFQRVNTLDGSVWRVFVQQIGQEELHHFSDIEQYFEFVMRQTKTAASMALSIGVADNNEQP